jgi:hypothetical protein
MSLTPPLSFKKGRAAWNAKTDAQRQKHIDFQLNKKKRKEDLIKQRAQEAKELAKGHGVQGLFPDYEDCKDMSRKHLADCEVSTKRRIVEAKQQAPAPFSFPDTSDATSVNQNVEETEEESKRIAIGYKSYEHKMVQSAEVPFDLDKAVQLRLKAMYLERNGLF